MPHPTCNNLLLDRRHKLGAKLINRSHLKWCSSTLACLFAGNIPIRNGDIAFDGRKCVKYWIPHIPGNFFTYPHTALNLICYKQIDGVVIS